MKRASFGLALLAVFLFGATVSAAVLPAPPEVTHLKNGLTVVMLPWSAPGMVAYYSVVRAGSRDETDKGHTGFAHLFEHMMFRGTKRFPKEVYESTIQALGADNNAFTWMDLTCFTVLVPTSGLGQVIEVEADRFQNLDFSEADFKTETGAVQGEYNMAIAGPNLPLYEKLLATAFTKHTYGHTTIGFKADIEKMPGYYNYAKQFYSWFYRPDNVTIVVAGDFDRGKTLADIDKAYGAWKGKRRPTKAPTEPEQKASRTAHVDWNGSTAPNLVMGYKIPPFAPKQDAAALEVLAALAFGETSPLYKQLVIDERKLLELGVSSGLFAPLARDPFLFRVYGKLGQGVAFDEIQARVTAAIEEVASGKLDPARLQAVKSNTRYSFLLGLETPTDVAVSLAMLIAATGDPSALDAFGVALEAVTADDVVRVAKTYLTAQRRTVVTLVGRTEGGAK